MSMGPKSLTCFQDLVVWQKAHSLALGIYKVTQTFPKEEAFGLTNQIRRAAVSVPSNIAEGFARRTAKEKINFYGISHGSVAEIQSQTLLARDIGLVQTIEADKILADCLEISKALSGLMRSAKKLPSF